RSLPPATDLLCAPAGEVLQHPLGGTVFVTYRAVCGGLQSSSFHIARVYRVVEVSWSGVTIANDSVVADVLIGLDAVSPEVRNTPPAAAPAPAP
ncbi:MAG TPA: hypothetical protein VFI13_13180, partial [Gemmatimonadales bacterium]|nr:hypothetical protein [Gemmatimonadales bacterium]